MQNSKANQMGKIRKKYTKSKSRKYSIRRRCRTTFRMRCASMESTIRRITAGRQNTAEWTQRAYKGLESVRESREELDKWREKYNNERPHSALNYEPPSTRRRPHGGDTNRFNLESINPINNNINQVSLLP